VSRDGRTRGLPAGIAVGATVGLEEMFAGQICGASMNPARSLAPGFVSGDTAHLWIYVAGPLAGAAAAVAAAAALGVSRRQ
jgi:aquaporin Z